METDLYTPIKRLFEQRGFVVRGEVDDCDLVAVQGETLVVVEMKSAFSLILVFQGIDRQKLTDLVYLAVEAPRRKRSAARWRDIRTLCDRLGLGLITVDLTRKSRQVEVVCDPQPGGSRKHARRRGLLLREFHGRSGDFNVGGTTRRPIMTAYREDALQIAKLLQQNGPSRVMDVRIGTDIATSGAMLRRNVYGWFERLSRGVYGLTPQGVEALAHYANVILEREPL